MTSLSAVLAAGGGAATAVLLQLGLVLSSLGLLGLAAHRLTVSPIPLYLLAGLMSGQSGPLPLVTGAAGEDFIEVGRSSAPCCCC